MVFVPGSAAIAPPVPATNAIVPAAIVAMLSKMAAAAEIISLHIFPTPDVSINMDGLSTTTVPVLL
jgi:hypothetical protein